MRPDFWNSGFWQWVDTTDALMFAAIWIAIVAVLVVRFVGTRRWDAAWKRAWEHKHRRSLDALRTIKQRHLKNLVAARWVTLGLFVVGFVTSAGLILVAGAGVRRWPPVLLDALIGLFSARSAQQIRVMDSTVSSFCAPMPTGDEALRRWARFS